MPKSVDHRALAEAPFADAGPRASWRHWSTVGGGVLQVALTVLVYWPARHGDFIMDDDVLLTDNTLIRDPGGLYQFWFSTKPTDYWPMTNTSLWLEWRLWGNDPTGYHVINIALHIVSALLVWWILVRLSIPGAYLAALLFAVHPQCVESVAWISQRKNTLSMCFFLFSIVFWLKSDERSAAGRCWYGFSLAAFLAAMLSKGSVAVLPLVLLALVWWQKGRLIRCDALRTLPFFGVAAVLTAVNIWFQTHGSGVPIREVTFLQRLAGAGAVVWFYLYKSLIPIHLMFIYPRWDIRTYQAWWWLPDAAIVLATAMLIWQRNQRWVRPVLLAWIVFCVALLPVLGFTDVGFMRYSLVADHYSYIALIAVMALVAAGCTLWYRQTNSTLRLAAAVTIGLLVATRIYLTWQLNSLFADEITLYQVTLKANPESWVAHNNLGVAFAKKHRDLEAIAEYETAFKVGYPDDARIRFNWGNALTRLENYPAAIDQYRQALRLDPENAGIHNNLGDALYDARQLPAAQQEFAAALRLQPFYPEAHLNLGVTEFDLGDFHGAVDQYRQAIEQRADYSKAWFKLALAYSELGKGAHALAAAQHALELAKTQQQPELVEQIEAWLRDYPNLVPKSPAVTPQTKPNPGENPTVSGH